MKKYFFLITLAIPLIAVAQTQITDATFGAIEGRQIGPAKMSGRITSIDAVNKDPNVLWVGAAGGGVWKSKNQGTTFKSVFDEYSQSIGAIAIDQNHPDTVWVGTGESWMRNSVSIGTGIYRTVNGGDKWELMGLERSERIAKIIINPKNSDEIYVAVPGALWSDSEDRGLYKTIDGGKTWNKILFVNKSTGCASIALDPNNSQIIYAAMWDFRRTAYNFQSGGPGSGLYKSTDAGKTWKQIQNGLPTDTLGRIAINVSPVKPNYVYALVESEKTALYRSSDKGEKWTKLGDQLNLGERPFYFSNIIPDPVDSNRLYKPGFITVVSNDGGKTFSSVAIEGGSYHPDQHALWINPNDNKLMYVGTDGGVYVSVDRGSTWRTVQNLPVSQFYHVSYDMATPYNVYGGLQDNGSWMAPSKKASGIQNSDWKSVGAGDGFNCYADKENSDLVYWQYQGGHIYRSNQKTGETKLIKPFPDAATEDLRFNWNAPFVFSKKTNTIYIASQYLYRSKDKGDTWERISPDLTTDDPNRQKQEQSGGVTADNSTAENNCTIFSVSESPLDNNIIWAGTDDGNIQLTTDGGKTWNKLNDKIKELPPLAFISSVDADNFDKSSAYITVDAHRNGDMKPYIFYTNDLGKTWQLITTENIKGYCHIIKQDIVNPDLLFLGTEFGLYVSINKGKNWVQFKSKIPPVAIYDIAIQPRENDLILATHGRGIIIVDDITPIRNLKTDMLEQEVVFLPNRPYYFPSDGVSQDFPGDQEFVGRGGETGALITYYMKKRHVFGDMYIELYDGKGNLIKKQPAGNRKGINRVVIDTRMKPPRVPSSINIAGEAAVGPQIDPGKYTVKLIMGDKTYSTDLILNQNQALKYTADDSRIRRDALMKAYNMLEELAYVDAQGIAIRDQTLSLASQIKNKQMKELSLKINKEMDALHKEIVSTQQGEGGIVGQIRLREKIAEIYGALMGYEGRPGNLQVEALNLYDNEVKDKQAKTDAIKNGELKKLNSYCIKEKLTPVTVITREEFFKEDIK